MSSTDDSPARGGLARSIDDLFERTLDADDEPSEVSGDPGAEEGDAGGPATDGGEAPHQSGPDAEEAVEERPPRPRDVERADPFMDVELVPDGEEAEPTGAETLSEAVDPASADADGTGGEEAEDAVDPEPAGARTGDEGTAETSGAVESAAPDAPSDSARLLAEVVREYGDADHSARDVLARRIRALAGELRDAGEYEPIVDAVESLAEVGDEAEEDEGDAAFALARILTGPRVAGRLCARMARLRDEAAREVHVRRAARLGPEMAEAVGEALAETDDRSARHLYMDVLRAMGDEGMRVVARMVEDSRWFVVRNAVLIVGESGGEESVQHLTTSLAHEDPRVRRETLVALAKIGGENAEMLVQNKLDDPEPAVREAAARAAGVLNIEKAVRPLVERLEEEPEEDVQIELMRALGRIGDPGAVPAIEKKALGSFFSKSSTPVRVAAYRALAAIGTPHARELVEEALEDRDSAVQGAARAVLQSE